MTDETTEAGYALRLVPLAKEIMDFVRERMPEGVEFAVLLVPPGRDEAGLNRIVAMSSDRDAMSFYAAQWAMDVLRQRKEAPKPPQETSADAT